MAGSYGHLAPPNGRIELLENGGDMREAIHELYWLVHRLASHRKIERLLINEYYPMRRQELPPDKAMKEVNRAFGGVW